MKKLIAVCSIVLTYWSCKEQPKEIISGDYRIKGDIKMSQNDTVYDGEILFYSLSSGELLEKANYQKGILQGTTITYINENLVAERRYVDGQLDGNMILRKLDGELIETSFYLKGREFGGKCYYDSGKISRYTFFSFDREMLLDLDYKILALNSLTNLTQAFFSFYLDDVEVQKTKKWSKQTMLYLYLFDPPLYHFNYSLVIMDSSSRDLKQIKVFDNKLPFANVALDSLLLSSYKSASYAIRLDIYDPSTQKHASMYKRI